MTEMTQVEWTMIQYWRSVNPKINSEELVSNLVRRFGMDTGRAWILVTQMRNEEHTRKNG